MSLPETVEEDRAKIQKAGIKAFAMKGAAARKYIAAAEKVQWERVRTLSPKYYDELRKKFPPSPTN